MGKLSISLVVALSLFGFAYGTFTTEEITNTDFASGLSPWKAQIITSGGVSTSPSTGLKLLGNPQFGATKFNGVTQTNINIPADAISATLTIASNGPGNIVVQYPAGNQIASKSGNGANSYPVSSALFGQTTSLVLFNKNTGNSPTYVTSVTLIVTMPDATPAPTTQMATTAMPTTAMPTTQVVTTQVITTPMPTTQMATTEMPTTQMATTEMPTTKMPTTQMATTEMPTTQMATTQMPATTQMQTTQMVTQKPTTQMPATTSSPTAAGPSKKPCARGFVGPNNPSGPNNANNPNGMVGCTGDNNFNGPDNQAGASNSKNAAGKTGPNKPSGPNNKAGPNNAH